MPANTTGSAFDVVQKNDNELIVKISEGYKPADVLQNFLQQKASIISFNEILPSLNDIFIKQVEDTKVTRQFQKVD